MLVLSCKKSEGCTIDVPGVGTVHVTVVDIRGDKVRLGFDAAKEIVIDRDKVRAQRLVRLATEGR